MCYTLTRMKAKKTFGFGRALVHLRRGRKVSRQGWNGKGQFIKLQNPTEKSKMDLPYLYITSVGGNKVPWLASQTDLLRYDWFVVA